MKSLEDLEKAFDRGLEAWECDIALKDAGKMGQKCVREVKRKTHWISGNLRRRWSSRTEKGSNDVEYAPYVNDGHRIVRGGKTVGYAEGQHMLEKGVSVYTDNYLRDDLQGMVDDIGRAMKGK